MKLTLMSCIVLTNQQVTRHVRQYASYKGLNSNDEESANITSYSTRVERAQKSSNGTIWLLTLRKLERLPNTSQLRIDWWQEEFDAVVVATGDLDSAHVPNITGIAPWGERYPDQIYHSQRYRRPEHLIGKACSIISPN